MFVCLIYLLLICFSSDTFCSEQGYIIQNNTGLVWIYAKPWWCTTIVHQPLVYRYIWQEKINIKIKWIRRDKNWLKLVCVCSHPLFLFSFFFRVFSLLRLTIPNRLRSRFWGCHATLTLKGALRDIPLKRLRERLHHPLLRRFIALAPIYVRPECAKALHDPNNVIRELR